MIFPWVNIARVNKCVIGVAAVLILGIGFWQTKVALQRGVFPRQLELHGERFSLEVVATATVREKGLGDRDSFCQECAMLFVFEKPGQYAFWMKDMRFPIDIIWLSKNRVVFVAREVSPDFLGVLNPMVIADQVIEVNAGVVKNIDVGEEVQFMYQ